MKTIHIDVDTQIDFLYPAGALYVPGAESIVPAIARLNHAAPLVISTTDAHPEDDPEFRQYPPHCVAGTLGQHKPAATLINDPKRQIVVEKQTLDCFLAPGFTALLPELDADRYVVYGVVSEICVRFAALGLLRTGKRVEIVTDAIKALDESAAQKMLADFQAWGGFLITAEQSARP